MCSWRPPLLELRFLRIGSAFYVRTKCTLNTEARLFTVDMSGKARRPQYNTQPADLKSWGIRITRKSRWHTVLQDRKPVVVDLLGALTRDEGTATLMVTHDHEFLSATDRTLTMVDGRLSAE